MRGSSAIMVLDLGRLDFSVDEDESVFPRVRPNQPDPISDINYSHPAGSNGAAGTQ
jgi:hypothetical protein